MTVCSSFTEETRKLMGARRSISILLVCAAFVGCQTAPDPSIELLESELRWYEDQLFLQGRELDQRSAQLESCKRYNAALKQEMRQQSRNGSASTGGSQRSGGSNSSSPASSRSEPSSKPSGSKTPVPIKDDFNVDDIEKMELDVPNVDYGDEVPSTNEPPQDALPLDDSIQDGDLPNIHTDDREDPFKNDIDDMTRNRNTNPSVAKIELNPRLTGGYDEDGKTGDEGIVVVIEPQSTGGEYVAVPGEVTVEAYESSNSTRLARWDFDAYEAASFMQESLFGKGIHLQLPWPGSAPESEKVRIIVNYVKPNGQRLIAKKDVHIDSSRTFSNDVHIASPTSKKRFATAAPKWKATR